MAITAGQTITVEVSGFAVDEQVSSWAGSARGSVYATYGGYATSVGNVTLIG